MDDRSGTDAISVNRAFESRVYSGDTHEKSVVPYRNQ